MPWLIPAASRAIAEGLPSVCILLRVPPLPLGELKVAAGLYAGFVLWRRASTYPPSDRPPGSSALRLIFRPLLCCCTSLLRGPMQGWSQRPGRRSTAPATDQLLVHCLIAGGRPIVCGSFFGGDSFFVAAQVLAGHPLITHGKDTAALELLGPLLSCGPGGKHVGAGMGLGPSRPSGQDQGGGGQGPKGGAGSGHGMTTTINYDELGNQGSTG